MAYEPYNIILINPYIIKQICPELPDSVDDHLITGFIQDEQESHLQNLLGCDLYNEILFQQSGNTLTAANSYIFNRWIIRILSKRVMIRVLYSSTYQLENLGVRVKISDQSDPATPEQMNTLKQIYENDVDRLSKALVMYMIIKKGDNLLTWQGI